MGDPGIALLGPLAVNGDEAALSPRDRVVLAALAIRPGETLSAERLADALWGEHPPPSWNKVVPGCILRLRRVLGTDAIETTPYGYRLALPADEVDTDRFGQLLQRGRELLEIGQPERARYTLDEALGLWRGRPLTDLDGWEPGRIEAERLTELRLEAEECRLEAALRAGRHAEVLAQAQSGVSEAPLRERRWALLALAQYQAGRQADALKSLQRARTALVTELGLDPGPELVALEEAILRQDPALAVPAAGPVLVPVCPYPGLICYDIADAEVFFGRDAEVAECLRRLDSAGFLAVVGPSGCGKSSLVRAGVGAALDRAGRRPVVVTPGCRPTTALVAIPLVNTVLVVDQFEEVFTHCTDTGERATFFAGLAELAARIPIVVSLRADQLGSLAGYPDVARLVERGLYLLGPMTEVGLRSAITGPAEQAGLLLEPGLVDLLVREVEGEPGALPLLSHALRQTWERREGRTMTVAGYQEAGGIRGCIAQSAEQLYESMTADERPLLRQVMLRLVSATNDGDAVRTRVSRRLLLTNPERERLVERLVTARLVTTDHETVEIAHEALARAWPRLSSWLDEDLDGQRILRHLSASADAWDAMGRPASELYRGTRLTQAMDWEHNAHPDITPAESDFLEASAEARRTEVRAAQQQARGRRRTRLLFTGAAVLLVAAVVAGLLAVRQQRDREAADAAALIAESTRVDDASRNTPAVDQALLLAVQANRIHDSPETRGVLTDLLSGHPALIRSLTVPNRDGVQSLAVSPDGRTLLVGSGNSGTSWYRTDTVERTASSEVPGWTMDYRADGQQLLLVARGAGGLGEAPSEISAAVTDQWMSDVHHLQLSGIQGEYVYANDAAYSADGRFLALYAEGDDVHGNIADSTVAVWNVAALDRPVMRVQPLPAFAVALSPDGTKLYLGTEKPALTVIDVATRQIVNSVPLSLAISFVPPPADIATVPSGIQSGGSSIWGALSDDLEVSPDGKTVAVAVGNDVLLYDATTLSGPRTLRGHGNLIRTLQFSHDGRRLASGSMDHTVVLWDVSTGTALQTLTGHTDAVMALAFSADDGTLYTGGLDRHVLVWDLTGRRQFVTRVVDPAPSSVHFGVAVPSPDGQAVEYPASAAGGDSTRFVDLTTGQLGAPGNDPGGGPLATWLPPTFHQIVTVAGTALRVRDRDSNTVVAEHVVTSSPITAIAAAQDGRFVVIGDKTGGVQRVDAASLQPTGPHIQLDHAITAIATGPADTTVAALDDKSYVVIDLPLGSIRQRDALGTRATVVALSPDGARLGVGGSTGEVGLFDLDSQEWIAAPTVAHREFVDTIAFAGDSHTFVTASFDGGIRVWDGTTGLPLGTVQAGSNHSPAFAILAPDGQALIATQDGAVYRLSTSFESWIGFACAAAGRDLTAAEWRAVFADQPYRKTCPAP